MTLEDLKEIERSLSEEFKKVDDLVEHNCKKVISAFWEERVDETFFNTSTLLKVISSKLPIGVGTRYNVDVLSKFDF